MRDSVPSVRYSPFVMYCIYGESGSSLLIRVYRLYDKCEWLEDVKHGDSSSASFMICVEDCISERESRRFEEGLNTEIKLDIYKQFGKSVEFKKYLR